MKTNFPANIYFRQRTGTQGIKRRVRIYGLHLKMHKILLKKRKGGEGEGPWIQLSSIAPIWQVQGTDFNSGHQNK